MKTSKAVPSPKPANGSPRDWSAEQLAANLNDGGPSVKRLNAVDDAGQPHETDDDEGSSGTGSSKSASRSTGDAGQRSFISYVATHPDDGEEGKDPDGVEHAERLALEVRAIELIRNREPALKTMPTHNKGFDLIETDANDEPERWIEVKAMKGSLQGCATRGSVERSVRICPSARRAILALHCGICRRC